MSRGPFVIYVVLLIAQIFIIAKGKALRVSTNTEERALPVAALMLLALPAVSTLRYRDMGRSVLWPLFPLTGLLILAYNIFSTIVAVSGAPSGGEPPSSSEIFFRIFVIGCLCFLSATTLLGMFMPSKPSLKPQEVSS